MEYTEERPKRVNKSDFICYRGCYKNNPCTYGESSNICKGYFCYSFF
nr:MAG TPA: hypothetical protein [Caudoviricetes sp.]